MMGGHARMVLELVALSLLACSIASASGVAGEHMESGEKRHQHENKSAKLEEKIDGDHEHTRANDKSRPVSKTEGKNAAGVDGWVLKDLQARTKQAEATAAEAKAKLKKADVASGKIQESHHTIQSLSEMLEKLHQENENTLKEREELQKKLSAAESEAGKLRESEAALKEHEKNLVQSVKEKEREAGKQSAMSNKTHSSLEQQQLRLHNMRADRDKLKLKLANSTTESASLRRELEGHKHDSSHKGDKQQNEAVASLTKMVEQMKNESAALKAQLAVADLKTPDHDRVESALVQQVATVQQAAEDVDALGPATGEVGEEAKRASVIALQRQMRKAVSFAAALKAKLDHGADILKKTISRSKQLGGYDDSDTDSAEGDIKGGGGGHNDTSVSIKRWTHAGLGLERLLESAESQALELENILIEDHNNVNGTEGQWALEGEVQKTLKEAEERVAILEARILTGDVGRNPMKGVSRKKIGELEAELALAQDHEREIQSSLSSLNAQHLKELAEHSKEHQVWEQQQALMPMEVLKRAHDTSVHKEEDNDQAYAIGHPPALKHLFTEHVVRTAEAWRTHMGPAEEGVIHKVEEVIYARAAPGRDVNEVSTLHKAVHVTACFLLVGGPAVAMGVLGVVLRKYFHRLVTLKGFISLCHQYGAGMCLLAMLAELWSGMEPMHLFYALDFHAYMVFNFMAAAMYVIYWGALLINAVIASGKPKMTVGFVQLMIVSAIGSEFYYAVFHRAMTERPPHMNLPTYAAYFVAFVAVAALLKLSTPKKLAEPKSL